MITNARWSADDHEYLLENFCSLTNSELSKNLGRSVNSIKARLSKYNLLSARPASIRRRANQKYSMNLGYFDTPILENCYWAGFIAADGCVIPSKNTLKITLASRDLSHLEKFKSAVMFTGNIRHSIVKPSKLCKKESTAVTLNMHGCPEILSALENNFNITANKTGFLQPPVLSGQSLNGAFIKGYLDGDGCINLGAVLHSSRVKYRVDFTGNLDILMYIRSFCDHVAPSSRCMPVTAKPRKGNKGSYYSYALAYDRAEKLLLYLDSLNTPCLERKWIKIYNLVNVEEEGYGEEDL